MNNYTVFVIFMQTNSNCNSFKMRVSSSFISLVLSMITIDTSNAYHDHINPDRFDVGDCFEAHYTAPPTGRASLNIYDDKDNIALHTDYRVHWGSNTNTIVLDTRKGSWGPEQHVTGITSTPATLVEFLICAEANDFSITFNKKQVATYAYRIPNANVTRFEYQNYGYDSKLEELCIVYSS